MKKLLYIYIYIHSIVSFSQNLVNNPSFEILSSCPTISNRQATLCVNWFNPTQAGTPDVYNTCLPGLVPSNGLGTFYQFPKTGNSYVGIWAYSNSVTNGREYLQTQLSNVMTQNNYYLVNFYANLVNWARYSSNNIGIYFSNTQISLTGSSNYLLNYGSQIKKNNNPILSDTLNWIPITGIYKALGGETYLNIGNFDDDATTDTLLFNSSINTDGAYYLIDDISVEQITTPQWQYRDTTVYLGDSVLIGPAISGLNVDWFDMSSNFIKNAPGIYVKPTVNTSYQATETFNSAVYNHTVNVIVLDPVKVDEYDKLQNSVSVYPNPSNGNFKLQFDDLKQGDIEVTINDIAGKTIYEGKHSIDNALTDFVFDAKDGIYFVKIYNVKSNQTIIKKLVVQK